MCGFSIGPDPIQLERRKGTANPIGARRDFVTRSKKTPESQPKLRGVPTDHRGSFTMSLRSSIRDHAYRMVTAVFGDEDRMVTLPVLSGPGKGLRIRADLVDRKD